MSEVPPRERGYAMLAAVAAIGLFGLVASLLVDQSDTRRVQAAGEIGRARAAAAAEAGFSIAMRDLLAADAAGQARIDGIPRSRSFDGAALSITLEDESGKAPINALDAEQMRQLFTEAGLAGEALDIAVDSTLDWIDDDDDRRPNGAEAEDYAAQRIRPRNGLLRSVPEIGAVRGIDRAVATRVSQIATVHFGTGPFRPERASPAAIRVVLGNEAGAVALIQRERVLSGQSTAIALSDEAALTGQPITVRVRARLEDGSQAERRWIVVLTGRTRQPFAIVDTI